MSTFSQIGGARLGSFNATWPLAKLTVTPEELRLSVLGLKFRFDKRSITRLSKHTGFMSSGLRIEHGSSRAPRFVVFWSFNLSVLMAALAQAGYPVS